MDCYDESNGGNLIPIYTGSVDGIGQSFTGDGGILATSVWNLNKTGSPTGNAVSKIYAHSGTFGTSSIPTGAALATSGNFDVSTLTGSLTLITFTFSGGGKIPLINGTKYVVTFEYGAGDVSNRPNLDSDASSPSHGGNISYDFPGWTADSDLDAIFCVYRDGEIVQDVIQAGVIPFPR